MDGRKEKQHGAWLVLESHTPTFWPCQREEGKSSTNTTTKQVSLPLAVSFNGSPKERLVISKRDWEKQQKPISFPISFRATFIPLVSNFLDRKPELAEIGIIMHCPCIFKQCTQFPNGIFKWPEINTMVTLTNILLDMLWKKMPNLGIFYLRENYLYCNKILIKITIWLLSECIHWFILQINRLRFIYF